MHGELGDQEEMEFKNSDVQRRSMAMKVRKMRVVSCCALEQIAWMCGDQERSLTKNEDIQYLKVKKHTLRLSYLERGGKESEDLFLEMIMYLVFSCDELCYS